MSRQRPLWLVFIGPYGLYLIIFLVVPLLHVALLSVYTYSPTRIALSVFTGSNYAKLWDPYYVVLLWRTMKLGLVTTVVCIICGYPVAYFLARATPRVATVGLFLLIMPLMVSTVIRVFGWIVILGRNGLINEALAVMGWEGVKLLYTEAAVVLGLVNVFLPFMVLPLMASIERIDRKLEEAARNLGATWLQMFMRVVVPLSIPGLVSGSVLVYSVSISAFVTPALMGGADVRMVGQQIYDSMLVSYNWPFASSLALTLIAITLLLLFVVLWVTRRRSRLVVS